MSSCSFLIFTRLLRLWRADALQMREAFSKQLENEDYQRFISKVPRIEGVWDDHDYGGEKEQSLAKTRAEQSKPEFQAEPSADPSAEQD